MHADKTDKINLKLVLVSPINPNPEASTSHCSSFVLPSLATIFIFQIDQVQMLQNETAQV